MDKEFVNICCTHVFSYNVISFETVGRTILWFLFSFVAGCVYIINDFMDLEADLTIQLKSIDQWHHKLSPMEQLFLEEFFLLHR